ncbi:MAG: hypothetical protein K2O91_08535 [Lachnospiraceae bacterium]|nr:hypothetical protein [Lachnospiraceae bacterium]
MIKAISTIIVGGRTFAPGQTVAGLSTIDRAWMKRAGYIAETADKKKNSGADAVDTGVKDGNGSGL